MREKFLILFPTRRTTLRHGTFCGHMELLGILKVFCGGTKAGRRVTAPEGNEAPQGKVMEMEDTDCGKKIWDKDAEGQIK